MDPFRKFLMNSSIKRTILLFIFSLSILQLLPNKQSQVIIDTGAIDFIKLYNPPLKIRNKLKIACYDCHSNNTSYPWYSKLQPVAWFLEEHITKGKEELNFSEWSLLSKRRQQSKLSSMINQVEAKKMPLDSYVVFHDGARFSQTEITNMIKWITSIKYSLDN